MSEKLTKEEKEFRSCPFCGKPCIKRSHQQYFYNPLIQFNPFAAPMNKDGYEWFLKMCESDD